jgi:hypothetical protein
LVALVLGTSPLDLQAEGMAGALTIANTVLSAAAEECCRPEAIEHADECLPLCGTGGQAVLPATIELPLPPAQGFHPLSLVGAHNRVADLEPAPPRQVFRTI